jgi:hypothetical protein
VLGLHGIVQSSITPAVCGTLSNDVVASLLTIVDGFLRALASEVFWWQITNLIGIPIILNIRLKGKSFILTSVKVQSELRSIH